MKSFRYRTNSDLADRAAATARNLSYNEDDAQAAAKHVLLECSSALDTQATRVAKCDGKLSVMIARGGSRPLTIPERILWYLFGIIPDYHGKRG